MNPPADRPFWVIGQDAKDRMRMAEVPAGGTPPVWATKWCCEGSAAWVPLPPAVEVVDEPGLYRRAEQTGLFGGPES